MCLGSLKEGKELYASKCFTLSTAPCLAARGTSQCLLFLPLLSAMGLHTSKILRHVWLSGAEPPCRLERGSAAPSSPPVSGPGCTDMSVRAFIFQLSTVPVLAVACPRVAYRIFVSKGTLKALVKHNVFFLFW